MHLLLLPNLPSPITFNSILTAYGNAISSTLQEIASRQSKEGNATLTRLDIAICTPTSQAPRTSRFHHWQSVVALLYQIICVKASEQSVELDIDDGVDARIIICDSFLEMRAARTHMVQEGEPGLKQGPIIDLRTLAATYQHRKYSTLFSTASEEGETVLQKFLEVLPSEGSQPNIHRVPGGPILHQSHPGGPISSILPPARARLLGPLAHPDPTLNHTSVAVGGTFDHIHIGHKLLLFGTALALTTTPNQSSSRHLTIGITGDALLLNKKHSSVLEDWSTRQTRTSNVLESILLFPSSASSTCTSLLSSPHVEEANDTSTPNGKFIRKAFSLSPSPSSSSSSSSPSTTATKITITYTQISDPYGPTITDPDISALVISAETRAGGAKVNEKRVQEKGWKELDVLEVDVLDMGVAAVAVAGDGNGNGGRGSGSDGNEESPTAATGEQQRATKTVEDFKDKISSTAIRRRIVEKRDRDGAGAGGDGDGK